MEGDTRGVASRSLNRELAVVGRGQSSYVPTDMDATYRPMYSSDVPLDPLDMHMDMDGDYPIDAYSDGLRPAYVAGDHMLP